MSWVPAAGGLREPTSRSAPRPAAATPKFTFGRLEERAQQAQGSAAPASPTTDRSGPAACYDEPVEKLRWWTEAGRPSATVSTMRDGDIEAFWRDARQDVKARVGELVNASAARLSKSVGLGSNIARSLQDAEPPRLAEAASSYKADFCSVHERVGRRGVAHSPEAVAAFQASQEQARRNKSVGRGTNLTLALF